MWDLTLSLGMRSELNCRIPDDVAELLDVWKTYRSGVRREVVL